MATYYGNTTGPSDVYFRTVVIYTQGEFMTSGSYAGKYKVTRRCYVEVTQGLSWVWSSSFKASWTGDKTYSMSGKGIYADVTETIYLTPGASEQFSYYAGYTSNSGTLHRSTATNTFTTSKKTFTITYNSNDGTNTTSSDTATYSESYITKANTFTRVGYTFIGWNEKKDGTGTDWTSYIGKSWTWNYVTDVVLYAQWRPNRLTISYNVNSGSIGNEAFLSNSDGIITSSEEPHVIFQEFFYNDTLSEGLLTHDYFSLYKNGYKFIGWSLDKNDNLNLFDETRKDYIVSQFSKEIENGEVNVTLYAQWEIQNIAYLKINGKYSLCLTYLKINNIWTPCIAYIKTNGVYKQSIV